jgi:hypothetical protein
MRQLVATQCVVLAKGIFCAFFCCQPLKKVCVAGGPAQEMSAFSVFFIHAMTSWKSVHKLYFAVCVQCLNV